MLLTKIIDDKDAFSLAFGISDSKILKLFLKEIRSKQHVYREKLDTIAAAFALLYHIDMLPTSFLELLAISAPSIIFHIQYLPLHIRVIAAAEISKVNQDAFIFSCNAIKSQSEKLRRYLFYIFSRNVKIAEEVLPLGGFVSAVALLALAQQKDSRDLIKLLKERKEYLPFAVDDILKDFKRKKDMISALSKIGIDADTYIKGSRKLSHRITFSEQTLSILELNKVALNHTLAKKHKISFPTLVSLSLVASLSARNIDKTTIVEEEEY